MTMREQEAARLLRDKLAREASDLLGQNTPEATTAAVALLAEPVWGWLNAQAGATLPKPEEPVITEELRRSVPTLGVPPYRRSQVAKLDMERCRAVYSRYSLTQGQVAAMRPLVDYYWSPGIWSHGDGIAETHFRKHYGMSYDEATHWLTYYDELQAIGDHEGDSLGDARPAGRFGQ